MRKVTVSLLSSMFIFILSVGTSYASPGYYTGTTVPMEPGDVVVTNNTSSGGLTGHAGMVTDSAGDIVSIDGYGDHPITETWSQWYSNNPNTKVMRWSKSIDGESPSSDASSAATWVRDYAYYYSYVDYGFSGTIGDYQSETYCSKIPWDAFYYGPNISIDGYSNIANVIYSPYHWLTANGMTLVAVMGSW